MGLAGEILGCGVVGSDTSLSTVYDEGVIPHTVDIPMTVLP